MQKIYKLSVLWLIMSGLGLILSGCGETTPNLPATNVVVTGSATASTTISPATAGNTTNVATSAASPNGTSTTGTPTTVAVTTAATNPNAAPTIGTTTANTIINATPKPTVNTNGFAPHSFGRVLIIMLENAEYDSVLANPYMAQLSKSGTLMTNYYGVAHPSYPNYLALAGGSTFDISSDGQTAINQPNLVDLLDKAGVSWKVYAEGLPGTCFLGVQSGSYVRKHEPFASFVDVQKTPARCAKIVNAEQLKSDVVSSNLPQYAMYVPNLNNDGHDTGINHAANWLQTFLSPLMADPQFISNTLVVITFDEGEGGGQNHIYTALLGQSVKAGATNNTRYDHYSLLRTVEDNFGLGNLGRSDAKASDIVGVWK